MNDVLNHDNFLLYCAKCYDASLCSSTEEFIEDLHRVKYIKKLLTRYAKTGELKERLILNHLIILNNVFGAQALPRILFLKMPDHMKFLKPFLIMLGICPDKIKNVGKEGQLCIVDEIAMDPAIIQALRNL
jgi:hypothetical protein